VRDPDQYARFADQRSRPFFTLLERVPADLPLRHIVDLGCGSGELTRVIAERWPDAQVLGLDNSPQMLARAVQFGIPGRLSFVTENIRNFSGRSDLIFSNAALQWVDDHGELFPRLASLVNPGGVLAVQMPYSHVQRSHELIEETARSGPWAARLAQWHRFQVQPLSWYVELMLSLGFEVDAWETTYHFVLQGENPVLEWVRGTSLQPILTALDEVERAEFISVYSAKLRDAYPQTPSGTIYPFRRIFFVARR
jgi:trans-aconitate 2-methyltransferase